MDNIMAPPTDSRKCPVMEWCTSDHFEDWNTNEHGDPVRSHTLDVLPQGTAMLVVDETRTSGGVTFGELELVVSGRAEEVLRGAAILPAVVGFRRVVDQAVRVAQEARG